MKVHTEIERVKKLFKTVFCTILRDTSNELPLNDLNTADKALNTNQSKTQSPNESTETEALY